MNRMTIAAVIAAGACAISIPAAALAASGGGSSSDTPRSSAPSHSRIVDDRSGPKRSGELEPGDDRGRGLEPGDDHGGHHRHHG